MSVMVFEDGPNGREQLGLNKGTVVASNRIKALVKEEERPVWSPSQPGAQQRGHVRTPREAAVSKLGIEPSLESRHHAFGRVVCRVVPKPVTPSVVWC